MKKVLFVATISKHIIGFHTPYLKWFKEQGYEVHVASRGNEKIEYCDKHFDLPFERFPVKVNNIKTYKQLKKIINDNEYEIIHCHTPVGGVLARLAARKARKKGTKVIYTAHGFHFYKGAPLINWIIYYPIEKICAKWTDCLITLNEEDYNLAKRKINIKRLELIHGVGVDESKFNFTISKVEKHELRKELGLSDEDYVMIIVAELNKNKNQIMAIKSMKQLVLENKRIKLLLVGVGNLESYYKDKVEEYKLSNNIIFTGYRKDVPKLLKISDCLLSLSLREGLPVNVIEALMSGLPIIGTDIRGNNELIKKRNDNILIKKGDCDELTKSIKNKIKSKPIEEFADMKIYSKNEVEKEMDNVYMSI